MKRFLLYSDVHFSQYSSIVRGRGSKYSVRLHNLINSISWAEHLAEEKNCDEIICLGDMMDRSDLNAEEITALQDVYFCDKPHTFITGNHDANISNLEFSTVQVFKSIKASIVVEPKRREISDKVDFYFIPYLTANRLKPLNDYLLNNGKKKVILTHNDIAGIQYGRFVSQSGFSVSEIVENCNLFLNGHLHNGCIIQDKIVLIGNLTGANFNEDASKYTHYAYILTINDDGSIDLEPYENPFAFNFYKLYINFESDLSTFDSIKNNAVLSVSCNSNLINKVTELLLNNPKVVSFRIVTMYNNSKSNKDEIVDFKVDDHIQQFIQYVQQKIQPSDILTDELSRLGAE